MEPDIKLNLSQYDGINPLNERQKARNYNALIIECNEIVLKLRDKNRTKTAEYVAGRLSDLVDEQNTAYATADAAEKGPEFINQYRNLVRQCEHIDGLIANRESVPEDVFIGARSRATSTYQKLMELGTSLLKNAKYSNLGDEEVASIQKAMGSFDNYFAPRKQRMIKPNKIN